MDLYVLIKLRYIFGLKVDPEYTDLVVMEASEDLTYDDGFSREPHGTYGRSFLSHCFLMVISLFR